MKTSVLVTAVAGSGKSTTCKALQSLGYDAYDIESIPGLYELVDEKTGQVIAGTMEQISEGVDWRCNKSKLQDHIRTETTGLVFYCGGMSNTEEVWNAFDRVIVLTVSDDTTVKRLSTRKAGEFGSSLENRDWVLSWKHSFEQRLFNMGGIPVSAEDNPEEVAKQVVRASL